MESGSKETENATSEEDQKLEKRKKKRVEMMAYLVEYRSDSNKGRDCRRRLVDVGYSLSPFLEKVSRGKCEQFGIHFTRVPAECEVMYALLTSGLEFVDFCFEGGPHPPFMKQRLERTEDGFRLTDVCIS